MCKLLLKSFMYFIIFFLYGCTKVKMDKEFIKVKNKTKKITGLQTAYEKTISYKKTSDYEKTLVQGISRDEAIGIALKNNPELQSFFDNLGIAKSDLVQAGLYTNPRIDSVFRHPTEVFTPEGGENNIEIVGALRLSDLWLVPLNKQVANDILEIMTYKVLDKILDIVQEVSISYNSCIKNLALLENVQFTLKNITAFKDQVYYRQKYGYSTNLDKYNIDILMNYIFLDLIEAQKNLEVSYIHLKKVLGLGQSVKKIRILESINTLLNYPNIVELEKEALNIRPEIQINSLKIKQYKDLVKLEKAKVWKDVDAGLSYKKDFERPFRGWGPFFGFSMPIFDNNYAQIARAEFLFNQSKKDLDSTIISIKEEVHKYYQMLNFIKEKVLIFSKSILPCHNKAIDWTSKYSKSMQINMLMPIKAIIHFYKSKRKLIETQYQYLNTFANLERSLGKRIESSK